MTLTHTMPFDDGTSSGTFTAWLDVSVRQCLIELAFAGANHGLRTEARAMFDALPQLAPPGRSRDLLHVALLIALGDTHAARAQLNTQTADATDSGGQGEPVRDTASEILMRWIVQTEARHAASEASSLYSSNPISLT